MKLVEVVRGITTSDETFDAGIAFTKSLGKLGIPTRDTAGFIVNRLLVPYISSENCTISFSIGVKLLYG